MSYQSPTFRNPECNVQSHILMNLANISAALLPGSTGNPLRINGNINVTYGITCVKE